jgi:Tol biopolymer transport system component
VSADGRYIVFVSNRGGNAFNVWRMDVDGGNPKQLTFGEGENFVHCTADNRWVVYATIEPSHPGAIWKVPLDGGDPVQLTDKPSSWPYVSPDGKLVTCTYREKPDGPMKLALLSIDGGPPVKLLDLPNTFRFNNVWSPDGRAISYLDARDGVSNIWNLPIDGSPAKPVTDFKANSISGYDWSRAGKRLVCSRTIETTSVVMIKNLK